MEHKTLSFEIKAIDYDGRTLEGFGAAFGNLDQVGDIIHPGAFKKTLVERGGKIKFLWQHDPGEPIGKLIEAHEEAGGLFVKAIISDTQRGRDALALLKDKAIGEMSIGYDTVKGGMDYSKDTKGNTVRNLREIKLFEISLVTFPANDQAVVTSVKEQDVTPDEGGYIVPPEIAEKMQDDIDAGKVRWEMETLIPNEAKERTPQRKYGRTISAATLAKLKAARDVIDELCNYGSMPEDDEDEDELPKEAKSATITVTPEDNQAVDQTTEYAAGPDIPPTDKLLKLIDLELSELHYRR